MSTAQQAWLQKLGGAKAPDKQFIDEIIKQEQARVQSQAPKLNSVSRSTVATARQEEKLTAEGPKPGERLGVISYRKQVSGFVMIICLWFLMC